MSRLNYVLTSISRINTTDESLQARKIFIFQHFHFKEQLEFHAQLRRAFTMFYNLGAWTFILNEGLPCMYINKGLYIVKGFKLPTPWSEVD